jgi:hypothetical protein
MGKRSMIRALGKTKTLRPGQPLTKHDFYLPLTDVLLDLVEKDLHSPEARLPAQLGCSLAHDFWQQQQANCCGSWMSPR